MKLSVFNTCLLGALTLFHAASAAAHGLRAEKATDAIPLIRERHLLRAATTLYGPEDTAAVATWNQAVSFCKSKGQYLATLRDYCDGKSLRFDIKHGDQWSPFSDYESAYVQTGSRDGGPCLTHRELGGDPQWAVSDDKNAFENNYILCKNAFVYGPAHTSQVKDWSGANAFCEAQGQVLAPLDFYCHPGETEPFFGSQNGDQWAPFADYVNAWVQVGTQYHASCVTHRSLGSDPDWGHDYAKSPYEANYIVCMSALDTALSLPPLTRKTILDYPTPAPVRREHTDQKVFQTCNDPRGQRGLLTVIDELIEATGADVPEFLKEIIDFVTGCWDALTFAIDFYSKLVQVLVKKLGQNGELDDLIENFLIPMDLLVQELLYYVDEVLGDNDEIGGLGLKVCAGDFTGKDVTDSDDRKMVDLCGELPLSEDSEWSVFAGELKIPNVIAAQLCDGVTKAEGAMQFSFCAAVSFCDTLPSIAFVADKGLASCLVGKTTAATSGLGTFVGYLLQAGFQNYGFGLSLTNAFEYELPVYNGTHMIEYKTNPFLYDKIQFGIKSVDLSDNLDGAFELLITGTKGISIYDLTTGKPIDEAEVSTHMTKYDPKGGKGYPEIFNQFSVELIHHGEVSMVFDFSKYPIVRTFLPTLTLNLFQASMFINTGLRTIEDEDGNRHMMYPGISYFVGSSQDATAIKDAADKLLKPVEAIVVILTKGLGIKNFSIQAAVDSLGAKLEEKHYYGFAMAANSERVGFRLMFPLGPVELTVRCTSQLSSSAQIDCGVQVGGGGWKIIRAILKEAVWVFHELSEWSGRAGKAVGLALERGAEKAKQVFSVDNVRASILEILLNGNFDRLLTDAASIGYELLNFCEEGDPKWPDGTACFNPTGLPKHGTCCNCANQDTMWRGTILVRLGDRATKLNGGIACGPEPKWGDGTVCKVKDAFGTVLFDNCDMCVKPATWWYKPRSANFGEITNLAPPPGWACGPEPCFPDGEKCSHSDLFTLDIFNWAGAKDACQRCCSGRGVWGTCGSAGCTENGSTCLQGATCNNCCEPESEWKQTYDLPIRKIACGREPCYEDGRACFGETCQNCCAGYVDWWYGYGLPRWACGSEPCYGDRTPCIEGESCNRCCNGHEWWHGPQLHMCGKEPCYGQDTWCVSTPGIYHLDSCVKCCARQDGYWRWSWNDDFDVWWPRCK